MKAARHNPLHRFAFIIGIIAVLLGLTVMLLDFLQGEPFSVISLSPVTIGILAIAVSLHRRKKPASEKSRY